MACVVNKKYEDEMNVEEDEDGLKWTTGIVNVKNLNCKKLNYHG